MKKLTLVLGGGACKGYAHIGVIKALEMAGIKPDLVVGTSMGAIVGGFYCSGLNWAQLIDIGINLTRGKLMDFNPFNALWGSGILSGKKLKKIFIQYIGDITHAQLQIPFIAIATDILNGKLVCLQDGSVVENMLASSAIPGVFPLVRKNSQTLCDGGLLNNVPDDVARKLSKNDVVLSIDVIAEYDRQVETSKNKIMEVSINALTLMQTEITRLQGDCSDLRINISQPDVAQMSFDDASIKKSINYGETAMRKYISKLKKMLQD